MVLLSLLLTDYDGYKPASQVSGVKKKKEREIERERNKESHLVSYAFPSGDECYMEIVLGVGRDSCKCIIK